MKNTKRKTLEIKKFTVAKITKPEKINGGGGGWTRVKDRVGEE
ncbi:MAG: hypothetical protein AAGA43_13340 [Bacteroidota bacterium]